MIEADVTAALDTVYDPELDEPITDLDFVRSVTITGSSVEVHLRLPTSFCSPNFAYIMASDAQDAVAAVPGVTSVSVFLDDHHDSDLVNRGLAAGAGYLGTFGSEAEESLDELRAVFRAKAHIAALSRVVTRTGLAAGELASVVPDQLPDSSELRALTRRRAALGLTGSDPLLVDADGTPWPTEEIELRLRRARSTVISIEGNSHFCRGLLRTRYALPHNDGRPLLEVQVS
jgi:metal-sulfur cluster biosynthetic enzyme